MRRSLISGVVLAASVGLGLGALPPPAMAGPARYDKESRSFRFAYTFADLPGGVGSVVGNVRKPTPEQEAKVKSLVGQVSAVLSRVTDGRAKIGQLDYVDDIKNSDLVVSLVGAPASPGWANMRAIEGRPGQIVLYYQSLQGRLTQDIVNTAAHEVCHYVFGLADEYNPGNFPGGCPRGSGPGCLMDNYNASARGFLGRLCLSSDHNVEPTQRAACHDIVEKFFADRGVTAGDPPGTLDASAKASEETVAKPDNRVSVVEAVVGQVRARRMQDVQSGKNSTGSLRSFASKTLRDVIAKFNRGNPDKVVFGGAEGRLLDQIVKAGEFIPLSLLRPPGLDPRVFDLILKEAERLGRSVADVKSQNTRQSRIRSGLQRFVQGLVKQDQVDTRSFAPADQRQVLDQLSKDAARDPKERNLDRLVGISDRTAQLDLAVAEDIIRVLDALGEPGTRQRLQFVNRVRGEFGEQFGIVGRDSSRFGFRRTQIITPDSPFGDDFYVLTQGGVFPFATVRDRSAVQFSRLINRSKIQLVVPESRREGDLRPIAARIELPFGDIPSEDPNQRRSARVDTLQVLAEIVDQLDRDRLENVTVLVPPGGLPASVSEQIPLLRSRINSGKSVRLDVVLAGAEDIPTELRDAVVDSRGSILTVTDIDEIGAIAQRLKNEQASGSWVIIPQPGGFHLKQLGQAQARDRPSAGMAEDPKQALTNLAKETEVRGALAFARDQIIAASEAEANVNLPRSEKAAQAVEILNRLLLVIGEPGIDKEPDPSSLARLREEINNATTTKEQLTAKPDGLNARLLRVIGRAKDLVSQVRILLVDALRTPRTDRVAQKLHSLALMIQGGRNPSEEKLVRAIRENDVDLANRVAPLGRDLDGLEELIRSYEMNLEASLNKSGDDVPIYKRIDRVSTEAQRLQLERAAIEASTGLRTATEVRVGDNECRLARFYSEGNAEFELILGLSQELPMSSDGTRKHPDLRLVSDLGVEVADSSKVREDTATSTPSLLVWRTVNPSAGQPLAPGWYTPIVRFDQSVYERLDKLRVNFTFSVGSNRPNVQLIAGLVQGAESRSSGSLKAAEGPAVVEVQVSAGSSVLGAHLRGFYQKITKGFNQIDPQQVEFRDDGSDAAGNLPGDPENFDPKYCDRAADDGIYTAFIPLIGISKDTEFRVFVQADTTDGRARYIGLDDPNRHDEKEETPDNARRVDPVLRLVEKQSTDEAEGHAMKFQRATSVHFRVEP